MTDGAAKLIEVRSLTSVLLSELGPLCVEQFSSVTWLGSTVTDISLLSGVHKPTQFLCYAVLMHSCNRA